MPSIGPRQATRLAFYIMNLGKGEIETLGRVVSGLAHLKRCPQCFFIHKNAEAICSICGDSQRRSEVIMILEKETDLLSVEKTKKYQGRYLVLGELNKNGILETESKLRLAALKKNIEKNLGGRAEEIILAINPTTYGDVNSLVLAEELKNWGQKITRLGRGIPTGGEIEFADDETLKGALNNRN